jgi:hypothetical protein
MSNVLQLRTSVAPARAESLTYTVAKVAVLLDLGPGLAYSLVRDSTIPAKKRLFARMCGLVRVGA